MTNGALRWTLPIAPPIVHGVAGDGAEGEQREQDERSIQKSGCRSW